MVTNSKTSPALSSSANSDENTARRFLKHIWYIASGAIVSAAWLALFVAGLMVNSSYYRAAVNYGFADASDWVWVILTFTVSNVAILAFFSGLLGGIISKLRATEGFTIDEKAVAKKKSDKEDKSIQVENPFISAVRGMFVFLAILLMQYVSSFNDLGSIGKNAPVQEQPVAGISYGQLSTEISEQIKDSVLRESIITTIVKRAEEDARIISDSALVNRIFVLKDSLAILKAGRKTHADSVKIARVETKIKMLRRTLKPPPDADFSQVGISSFSYFKFAVIVSFLAFIFGYDASKFAAFLGKLPVLSGADKKKDDKDTQSS